jgi:hypothetical protein
VRRRLLEAGIRVILTPVRAPNAHAYAERFVLSIKEACLDRIVPIGERHVRRAVGEDVEHATESDSARAGQSTDRGHGGDRHSRSRAATPAPRWAAQFLRTRSVISASAEKWNLPGLLNYYERAA